ncbi:MAG: polyprenyl synthetase family protein [Fimbriimonadaceae bacterium]|nr:polyprenyl synthetase family protein [Fimbriimonadaceae bacterium]
MSVDLQAHLSARAALVEAALERLLPAATASPARLHQAMRYSTQAGGKRLRPALVMDACEVVGGDPLSVLPTACAVECVHTYSLIHDDLPCMDDDDLRRGRPSCHRQFDEETALLAGDALQALAFELIAGNAAAPGIAPAAVVAVVAELATAAGAPGMVGGQMLDLLGEQQTPDGALVEEIHLRKTTALLRCSVRCGALLGGGDAAALDAFGRYGTALGLAFQITDDILDIEGDEATLGKPVGSDVGLQKATWPAVFGLAASKQRARELAAEAVAALDGYGPLADPLRVLARFVVERHS